MLRVLLRTTAARVSHAPAQSTAIAKLTTSRGIRWSSSLVTPEWLQQSDLQSGKVRAIDCAHPIAFNRGHIPFATSFYGFKATNLKDTRPGATGVMNKLEFQQLVDAMGINGESTLVFYDDELSIGATRAWWVFLHYGYPKDKLKILDGGWRQWVQETQKVSTDALDPPSRGSVSLGKPTGKLIGLDEVQSALLQSSAQFIDARSEAEYIGAQANGNRRVGHVPGAIHFDWVDAVDRDNGRFKSKDVLADALIGDHRLEDNREKPLITYCQRGIRAAHTAFVLQEILGYKDVKIYEDSMLQYLNRDDTAIEHL